MLRAGQQVLLMNTSGHVCHLEGQAVSPGEFIEVVLDTEFDPLNGAAAQGHGPWSAIGWTSEEIKQVVREIRYRGSRTVVWDKARLGAGWQDYVEHRGDTEHTVVGTVKVLPNVWSPQLGNQRDILVYLPPSYEQGDKHYPVIYMHDGQNLFDETTSFGCEWRVDETLEAASAAGVEAVIVGIPNMCEERLAEYSPFADPGHGGGRGAAYLAFIVETVKPRIDQDFRTLSDREHTGILGSSMGGLISLYAFFRHSETFGFAGVMSPALWFGERAIFGIVEHAPYMTGKLYLDVGTREGTSTVGDTRKMYELLQRKGYHSPHQLFYLEEQEAEHCEAAWAGRLSNAVQWLLATTERLELPYSVNRGSRLLGNDRPTVAARR